MRTIIGIMASKGISGLQNIMEKRDVEHSEAGGHTRQWKQFTEHFTIRPHFELDRDSLHDTHIVSRKYFKSYSVHYYVSFNFNDNSVRHVT